MSKKKKHKRNKHYYSYNDFYLPMEYKLENVDDNYYEELKESDIPGDSDMLTVGYEKSELEPMDDNHYEVSKESGLLDDSYMLTVEIKGDESKSIDNNHYEESKELDLPNDSDMLAVGSEKSKLEPLDNNYSEKVSKFNDNDKLIFKTRDKAKLADKSYLEELALDIKSEKIMNQYNDKKTIPSSSNSILESGRKSSISTFKFAETLKRSCIIKAISSRDILYIYDDEDGSFKPYLKKIFTTYLFQVFKNLKRGCS